MTLFIIWLIGAVAFYLFTKREFKKDNNWTLRWRWRMLALSIFSWATIVAVLAVVAFFWLNDNVKIDWDKPAKW